ncbi:hypothetical protein C1H46_014522 [Malus baccata]|uniref:Uncharacterized protein n=1 Tax=Malus baccata TaxID=106549 RepID=A0A540MNF0_MALBA|nr:hypothetical protein C1H46_014522 [Malus baccata]
MHQSHQFNRKSNGRKAITCVLTETEVVMSVVASDPLPQDSELVEMWDDVGEDDGPGSQQWPRKRHCRIG